MAEDSFLVILQQDEEEEEEEEPTTDRSTYTAPSHIAWVQVLPRTLLIKLRYFFQSKDESSVVDEHHDERLITGIR